MPDEDVTAETPDSSEPEDIFVYDPDAILADPNAHPIHKAYAAINIGIRDRGEVWAKCPNCGNPYQITPKWSNKTVCSDVCAQAFGAYIMDSRAYDVVDFDVDYVEIDLET